MATKKYDDLGKDELVRLLEARDRRDATRFGLVWEANEIDRDNALNKDFVALDLNKPLSVGDGPWRNLIIEGDNFDALRYLRMTFAGRVKCIYIDPPYNTGNRDFIYNDRFVEKEDLWRHSKWCEFMYQRLILAKDLLSQDGAVFVSIDDNELPNLTLLMNRIFGEANFVANIIWQKRYSSANDHKTIAPMHDYVVAFRASPMWKRHLLPRGEDKDRQYRFEDESGVFRCSDYTCNKTAEERPNLFYALTQPNTGEEIWPKRTRVWGYSKEEHERNVQEGLLYWGKDGKGRVPSYKRYKHSLKNADGVVPNTWWPHTEVGHNDIAKKELLECLPDAGRTFSTPKPTTLITRILQIAAMDLDDIVLDFFAGSGTTGHAVLKLNAEDGGRRRFILVSNTEATADNPDKNLCRDVCAKRIKAVIQTTTWGEGVPPGDLSAAYLRCRRIDPGRLMEIEHAQVWTALQLIHCETLAEYRDEPILRAGDDEQLLVYVPRYRRGHAAALRKAVKQSAAVIIYSWQPEVIRELLREELHVQVEPVPESLARRFGMTV